MQAQMSEKFVASIDQGTTSTRCMVFNREGRVVSVDQREHEQIFPKAGWVEHNAEEIWKNVREVVGLALTRANLTYKDLAAVGITNQRETAVVWDRTTGKPVYNAIVWQDTRTQKIAEELGALGGGADRYKAKVGLPLATYFSGPKVKWILDNVEGAGPRRRPVTCCSATWTRGASGTSPAAPAAGCTSPTRPTPAARC